MKKFLALVSAFLLFFNFCFSMESVLSLVLNNKFKGKSLIIDMEQTAYYVSEIPAKYFLKIYCKDNKIAYTGNFWHPYFEKEDLIKAGKDESRYVPKEKLKYNRAFYDGTNLYMDINEKGGCFVNFDKVAKFFSNCSEESYKKIKKEKINNYVCDLYEADCLFNKHRVNMKYYINSDKIKIKTISYSDGKLSLISEIKKYKINAPVDDKIFKPTEGIEYQDWTEYYTLFLNLDKEYAQTYYETGNTETAQSNLNDLITKSFQKSMEDKLKKSVPQSPEELLRKSILGW